MTYSITALDAETGQMGVAVASRFFAVGALVPHLRGGKAAVATQAFVSPLWGMEAAERLATGHAGAAIIADFVARDAGQTQRQIHMTDAAGRTAAHTGADCVDWCGHLLEDAISVAGNMLAGPQVLDATLAAYREAAALPFADRLLTAMEAGEAAGGDKRGRQSASLTIHRGEDYPWLDIRADDHPDPLAELRRLHAVAAERFLHVAEAFSTRTSFSRVPDRAVIDAAIARAEDQRDGPSQSFATPLT